MWRRRAIFSVLTSSVISRQLAFLDSSPSEPVDLLGELLAKVCRPGKAVVHHRRAIVAGGDQQIAKELGVVGSDRLDIVARLGIVGKLDTVGAGLALSAAVAAYLQMVA